MVKKHLLILPILFLNNVSNPDYITNLEFALADNGYLLTFNFNYNDLNQEGSIYLDFLGIYTNLNDYKDQNNHYEYILDENKYNFNYSSYQNLYFYFEDSNSQILLKTLNVLGNKDTLNDTNQLIFIKDKSNTYYSHPYKIYKNQIYIPNDVKLKTDNIFSFVEFPLSCINYVDFYLINNERKYELSKKISEDKQTLYLTTDKLINIKKEENNAYINIIYNRFYAYDLKFELDLYSSSYFEGSNHEYTFSWSIYEI